MLNYKQADILRRLLLIPLKIINFILGILGRVVSFMYDFIDDWLFWKVQRRPTKIKDRLKAYHDSKSVVHSSPEDAFSWVDTNKN